MLYFLLINYFLINFIFPHLILKFLFIPKKAQILLFHLKYQIHVDYNQDKIL